MLEHFGRSDWEVEVLTVRPDRVNQAWDHTLKEFIPHHVLVHEVNAIPFEWTRTVGFGGLGYRARNYLRRRGDELLRKGDFDLVFFSTTEFYVLTLGPYWKRTLGMPYVIDMHDPWVETFYQKNKDKRPPGGHVKYTAAQWLARRKEKHVYREAAHVITVSDAYPSLMMDRYPELPSARFSVIPFGVSTRDFQFVVEKQIQQTVFDPDDGRQHWVYAGSIANSMLDVARAILIGLKDAIRHQPRLEENLRLHFVGTSYSADPAEPGVLRDLIEELELSHVVHEYPLRIPYFQVLRCLRDARGIFIIGSTDTRYNPSKLLPYLYLQKPTVAVVGRDSAAHHLIKKTGGCQTLTFEPDDTTYDMARHIKEQWFGDVEQLASRGEGAKLSAYTAEHMTQTIVSIFNAALDREVGLRARVSR